MSSVIVRDQLQFSGTAHAFEGERHGEVEVSFFLVDGPPGSGPRLHRHPYAEVFVVQEGVARFTVDGAAIEATPGRIVVVPPGQPHKFVNSGDGPLRLIAIHANSRFVTEWLEDDEA